MCILMILFLAAASSSVHALTADPVCSCPVNYLEYKMNVNQQENFFYDVALFFTGYNLTYSVDTQIDDFEI